jgi:eukaryotic-like serine/threonine-protein kinase
MSVTAYERLPLDSQRRLDAVCLRFEQAWAGQDRPDLTDHLASAPPGERTAWLTELLHLELECRRRAGEAPFPDEYHHRLPTDSIIIDSVFAEAAAGAVGVGSMVGKYRLSRLIGRGGMSSVYEADDPVIGRPVAVKLLTGRADAARVTEEARLAGRLAHPNIVTIYEAGCDRGVWYMAMERLAASAADRVKQAGPFDPVTATRITADVCRGLVAAHAAGLVHRDIKPANVLLTGATGALMAKLSDFGLAHDAGEVDVFASAGTPSYMPPEEFVGHPTGPRGDIYSLGATYYTLLTGRPPYETTSVAEARAAHHDAPLPNPRAVRPEVPKTAAHIVARAMAKNPINRYPDAGAMLADLEAVLAGRSIRPKGTRRALIVTGVLVLAALTALAVVLRLAAPHEELETSWIDLFNGDDLTGWQPFVAGGKPGEDPGGVFSVVETDGGPVIRANGDRLGGLTTLGEYENYHLRFEYRWETPKGQHNSGVAYHATGPHGQGFRGLMKAHEMEIYPPNTGGYYRSADHRLCDVAELRDGRLEPTSPAGLTVRARKNCEHQFGLWNQMELVCVGDSALHIVNGFVVLALTHSREPTPTSEVPLTRGRLQLQSYKGGIYFRRIQIRPVTEIPARFHRMVAGG